MPTQRCGIVQRVLVFNNSALFMFWKLWADDRHDYSLTLMVVFVIGLSIWFVDQIILLSDLLLIFFTFGEMRNNKILILLRQNDVQLTTLWCDVILKQLKMVDIHNKVVGNNIIGRRLCATLYHMRVYSSQVNDYLYWWWSFVVALLIIRCMWLPNRCYLFTRVRKAELWSETPPLSVCAYTLVVYYWWCL